MCDNEKGQFDYTAEEWVRNQHGEDEWANMADEEQTRLIELEEQDREFIGNYLASLSEDND